MERQSKGAGWTPALHYSMDSAHMACQTALAIAWQLLILKKKPQGSMCLDTILESKVLNEALFNLLTLLVAKHHKRGQQYGRQSTDNISGDSWGATLHSSHPSVTGNVGLGQSLWGGPCVV